ncbi:MAG: zinc-ribbon domain-containing protein [Lachnospiraceae bacterium]|nr:zinc-ribbon domain-containing protein [Lachnospiraceae bacterium]
MEGQRFCRQCGTELTPGAKFCRGCGAAVQSVEQPAASAPATPVVSTTKKCPGCGAELDPNSTAKFCRVCGYKLDGAASSETNTKTEPVINKQPVQSAEVKPTPQVRPQPTPQPTPQVRPQTVMMEKPSSGGFPIALIIGLVVGVILLAGVTVFILVKKDIIHIPFFSSSETEENVESGDSDNDSSLSDVTGFFGKKDEENADEKGEKSEKAADATGSLAKADKLVEENCEKVLNDDLRADATAKLLEAMDLYKQAGPDAGGEGMKKAYTYYVKGTQKQVDLLMTLDIAADVYAEIQNTIDETLSYGQDLQSAGFSVDTGNIETLRNNIEDKYKALYIEKFNGFIDEYNWNVRYNEEFMRGALEAFPSDDPDDPIRLRYAYAKAWLVHQEIVEGMNDGTMDSEDAVKKIIDEAEDCDYAEFLLREAEAYMDQKKLADAGKYFAPGKLLKLPVLEDSSTREYSEDDIDRLNLSSSALRYARLEIYARHNLMHWDSMINKTLNTENGIDYYKFMSYNDFGEYSTDKSNGLTKTERHNIRVIAEYEMEHAKEGYFPYD